MTTYSKVFLFFLLFTLFFLSSCSSPTNPDLLPSISLTVDGVTSTEAFVKLSTNNVSLPASVTLSRNNKQINSFTLITTDTTIVDLNLNPNQSYTYSAEITDADNKRAASGSVLVQTMDTTSHNFTWQTYKFGGQGGSSTLFDVAIINENDIWAVGQMYVYDSTGRTDPVPYSIAKWNGVKWKLKKLFYNNNMPIAPIRGILILSPNDIWLAAGSIFHWDGVSSSAQLVYSRLNLPDPNSTIEKLWGNSGSFIYGVGNAGTIVFYNGSGWQKINSGTELNVNDIWGDFNKETGKWEILAVASNIFSSFDRAILSINPATRKVTQLFSQPIQYTLKGVWFNSNKQYYVSGDGIFKKYRLSDNNWENKPLDITRYFINKIRGNDINDVVAVGAFGEILHYNGVNWKSYRNTTKINNGAYYSVRINNNLVVAVGEESPAAVLIIGKR